MIDIDVADDGWTNALPQAESLARGAAELVLAAEPAIAGDDVAILLTDDAALADLNRRFRGRPDPTNVLSFPAPASAKRLGDIAVALGVCAREARDQAKPLGDHLQHLVVHGMLHLIGYDHEVDADAERMEAQERDLLARLGVPDPYQDRGDQGDHVQHGQ